VCVRESKRVQDVDKQVRSEGESLSVTLQILEQEFDREGKRRVRVRVSE